MYLEGEGSSVQVRTTQSTGAREQPDWTILRNVEELDELKEISTNYIEYGELYNRKTTVVDIYFVSKIVDMIDEDPQPKSMGRVPKVLRLSQMERNNRDIIVLA